MKNDLVDECYERSLGLLRENARREGIIAAAACERSDSRNYTGIFGRDASICVPGMVLSGDQELIRAARASLLTLARFQSDNGQIPNYVKPGLGESDFWYFGCIDATLWWLIALDFYDRCLPGDKVSPRLRKQISRALRWLSCREHQALFLLEQNEASDWADIMPRSGFVLYTNALWHYVKVLYGLPGAQETARNFNSLFFPFGGMVPEHRRARLLVHYVRNGEKCRDFYLSFINFAVWGGEIDVFGNILSLLLGPAPASRAEGIVKALLARKANYPHPVRVVLRPFRKNTHIWRLYMQRHRQNLPYQYHNGGIWPFAGGFWVMLLTGLGKREIAKRELAKLAEVNKIGDWGFHEWLHGKTGEAMGMTGQSWNAAMFVAACRVVRDRIRLFDRPPAFLDY